MIQRKACVGPAVQQQFHHLDVALHRGNSECCCSIQKIDSVNVDSTVEIRARGLDTIFFARADVQIGLAIPVGSVDIHSQTDQFVEKLGVANQIPTFGRIKDVDGIVAKSVDEIA